MYNAWWTNNRKNRPWLSKQIIQAIHHRNTLFRRAKSTVDSVHFAAYKSVRNKVVKLIRAAQKIPSWILIHPSPKNSGRSVIPSLSLEAVYLHWHLVQLLLKVILRKLNFWMHSLPHVSVSPILRWPKTPFLLITITIFQMTCSVQRILYYICYHPLTPASHQVLMPSLLQC